MEADRSGSGILMYRTCRKCNASKPITHFATNGKSGRGQRWRHSCRLCDYIARSIRGRKETPTQRRQWSLKRNYGLTPETYQALLDIQEGLCKICRCTPEASTKGVLYVDHDHITGLIRGLLCNRCNSGLGQFADSVGLLQSAIHYLQGFPHP